VAPFLMADTFERTTPDLLTISFGASPDSRIDLTARCDNSALYFISAMSPGVRPNIRLTSFGVFAVTDLLSLAIFRFMILPKVPLETLDTHKPETLEPWTPTNPHANKL
jgi:hypothetical protein